MNRAIAAVVAIISADEPEIPAPAGDSESVSINAPSFGAKNCSSRAVMGRRNRVSLRISSKLSKCSSLFVSSERKCKARPLIGVMRHVVWILTAKFSVSAPG